MEICHLVICSLLLIGTLCFSTLEASSDLEKSNLPLDANVQSCNCENGKCVTDKLGHSKCVCKPGFALQDEFTCKPCDCGSLGKCIFIFTRDSSAPNDQLQYQKKCVCDVGTAEKDGLCVDCDCGENSACDFDHGEKRCYCIDGYSEKDGVCTKCDCGFYGNCAYEDGNKKCECDEGYLELNGVCEECDCGDHGTCSFVNGQQTCTCEPGYSVKDGKCEACDCGVNSRNCAFIDGVKQCLCNDMYADRLGTCEECYCGDHATSCNFNEGQKTCSCSEGYAQKGGSCEPCDCGVNSRNCAFVDGVKQCLCNDMHADRLGTCEECYCGDHATSCNFNEGQKTCSCSEGYVQKGGSCELGCSDQQPCQNGGYCKEGLCLCLNGTRGEFCEVIDECSFNLCPNQNNIECAYDTTSQKAICRCLDNNLNYDPITKQCRRTCQEDKSCKNQAKCTGMMGEKFCECLEGTTGDFCEEVPVCDSVKCGSDAYCAFDPLTKKASCACTDSSQYYEPISGKCRRSCKNDNDCINGGKCVMKGGKTICNCLPGTQGDRCEIVNDCSSGRVKCFGDSAYCSFDVITRKATCKCNNNEVYDFRLGMCRYYCKKAADCFNGGICAPGGFCACPYRTHGVRCEIVDDCYFGRVRCNGSGAVCVYNPRIFSGTCVCKNRREYYNFWFKRCMRR